MYKYTICLFFLLSTSILFAQNNTKEARRYMEEGKASYDAGYYTKALTSYLKAVEYLPADPGINYSIAHCYMNMFQHGKALPYLIKAKSGGVQDPLLDLYLGVAYHANSQYDDAIKYLTAFKSTLRSSDKELLAKTDKYLTYCSNAKVLIQNPVKMTITNLGPTVNSPFPDYNPAISVDESTIIFTSRREGSTGQQRDLLDNHYYEDIYISNKNKNGQWEQAANIGNLINSASHDACVSISADGNKMLVYKTDNGGDLFYSELNGSSWGAPVSLGKTINSDSYEPCGNFSADGSFLFFVSDRKGGYGGTDIYVSQKNAAGAWSSPVNMGPMINTSDDEFSPYLHADGKTFYFSSDGHGSMGGFDIFQATINLGVTPVAVSSKPVNMGYPINTSDDEIYFVWSADNKRAYFSSAREGGYGDKDLYMLERPEAKAALVMLKGTIQDCKTFTPIETNIDVRDNETGKLMGTFSSNSTTGKYIVVLPAGKNYGISVDAKGYLFYSKNIDIPNLADYKEMEDLICLNKINIGTKIILHNVFFDVNKATLRAESESELEKVYEILKQNPQIKIEVSGHTDGDGDAEHNISLSEARAHAVKDYLISKGISADRISYKGYGESQPLVENTTPENKQLNRRTEIKILSN